MMRIGGRVGFDRVEDLEELFKSIDFPIELALPWKYRDLWLPVEGKVDKIIDFLKEKDIAILSKWVCTLLNQLQNVDVRIHELPC